MLIFILAYLGGILTIVSPCILPVLPFVFARADRPFVRNGLPLLVGMGQDDSLHLIHRYREEGVGSLKFVLQETGGAVFLTTLTTVIGFSSMLFVSHQSLRSLGWTAVLGMTLCLVSSVLVVPAGLRILEWLRHRDT